MYLPQIDDERATLCNYLDMQLDALRAAAYGLDDEQARRSPLRSRLSISGLLKHACFCLAGSLVGAGLRESDDVDQDFHGSFTPAPEETLDVLLERFDALRTDYLAMCREGDLETVMPVGPFPWVGMDEPREATLRYLYVHHIEEFARHAGHADVIREEIDGATAMALNAAIEGRPANPFVTPWTPAG